MRDTGQDRPRARRARARPNAPGSAAAARPATRRPGSGRAGETTRTVAPRPPSKLTGRAIVLTVVLIALGLSYVFPLRVYLSQQAEISALRTAQDEQRAHIAELAAEAAKWRDDEYIRINARRRLHFAEPNEILMVTVWDDELEPGTGGMDPDNLPAQSGAWWDTLWASIEAANRDGG